MSEYNVKEVQNQIEKMLNSFSYRGRVDEFNKLMLKSHPVLQQIFTNLCLDWLKKMSTQEPDLRNQASVQISKKIMEAVEDDIDFPMM